jgi:hypothetical protein
MALSGLPPGLGFARISPRPSAGVASKSGRAAFALTRRPAGYATFPPGRTRRVVAIHHLNRIRGAHWFG